MKTFSMKVFDILNASGHTILAGSNRQLDGMSLADIAKLIGHRVRVGFPEGIKTFEVDKIDVTESITGQKNIFIAIQANLPKMRNVQLQASSA